MQQHTVQNDGNPNLRFEGEIIAEASTSANNACSDYSGSPGRWTELRLYRTKAGKFVAERVNHTQWQGETDSHAAEACNDEEAVIAFFGHDQLAKEIYYDAEIDAALAVD